MVQNKYFNNALKYLFNVQDILVFRYKKTYFYDRGNTKEKKGVNNVKAIRGKHSCATCKK